mmetsp:Transcript_2211/g.7000  ORF Transcript_2211/g.7000 Transcript_2211/m.7000 type:complete len:224 (+) Transcript_2211:358-1029(+)
MPGKPSTSALIPTATIQHTLSITSGAATVVTCHTFLVFRFKITQQLGEIVAKSDTDQRIVGRKSKHREESKKDSHPLNGITHKGVGVEGFDLARVEGAASQIVLVTEGQQRRIVQSRIYKQNHAVVRSQHHRDPLLVLDRTDQTGQAVMTHERVDEYAKQGGKTLPAHHGNVHNRCAQALTDRDEGDNDHHEKGKVASDDREELQILGLLKVEETERYDQDCK